MSDQARSEEILRPYRDAVEQHGPGFEATLWGSRQAQTIRFDVMIELVDFGGCTILDAGCGHGDFAQRLLDRDVPFHQFVGLDAMPDMIGLARERDLPRCIFDVADFVGQPTSLAIDGLDWVCLSGTLNTMSDDVARPLIRNAFDVAAQGVVFNFLSNRPHPRWHGRDLTPARRFDTAAWIDWAMDQTSHVDFTQTYLDGHDATIVLRHDGRD